MCVETSRFANICAQIKQIFVIFNHIKLWVEIARHSFKWLRLNGLLPTNIPCFRLCNVIHPQIENPLQEILNGMF